jgi:hypothetical protein
MSTAPKGYSTSQKLDRLSADYACVSPLGQNTNGLAVKADLFVFVVANDAVESGSTINTILATGHAAIRGDVIRFTSGALDGIAVSVVSTATNSFTISEDLSVAPSVADTFVIQRFINPVTNSAGGLALALSYIRDGASQDVIEDTVNPANNRPLPVALQSVSGPVNVTAGDLEVNIEHNGTNPSSVRVGDGTTIAAVTTDNELQVKVTSKTALTKVGSPVYNDYTSTAVTTAAYTQLIASTASEIKRINIFDSSGETMIIATGAAGFEIDHFFVFPGGIDEEVAIPAGTRISIKAKTANATVGYFAMNTWK